MVIAAASKRWDPDSAVKPVGEILAALEIAVDDATRRELEKVFQRREYFHGDGRGHLTMLIRTITESEGNEGALIPPVISAVNSAMRPEWTAKGMQWIEIFDKVPLLSTLDKMRSLELFRETSLAEYLGVSIQNRLWKAFGPDVVPASPKVKQPPRPPASIARTAMIEKRIQIGVQLIELRSTAKSNRAFGALREKHFPDINAQDASELMKVARLYWGRPEIYRRVGWKTLACLASPSLGADQRRRFETSIISGKRIFGKDVERARGRLPSGRPKREADQREMMAA
jgi:hypothetical protein